MVQELRCTNLTKKQYDDLIMDLRGKIFVILMNIEVLLEKNGKLHDIGLAVLKETRYNLGIVSLYIHAIEQLGKLIMVKNCQFDGAYYDLDSIKSDFYDHNLKIQTALDVLPAKCKNIFIQNNSQSLPNFDLRLKLLHSDIDENGDIVIAESIDVNKIKEAIKWFKTEQYSY